MEIVIDIETIPDQSEGAIERFMGDPVKCPFDTKAAIGESIGLSAGDYKFIGKEDLKQRWIDEKGQEAAKEQAYQKWLKTSFDGSYGEVCCICIHVNGYKTFLGNEKEILVALWEVVSSLKRPPYFIAHNAKFDLPFLWKRSVINGIKPASGFNPYGRNGTDFYCTMESWAGFNGRIGLDNLAKVFSIHGKMEGMTGADVWPEYKKGNIAKIAEYCRDDVKTTKEIYEKLTFKTI